MKDQSEILILILMLESWWQENFVSIQLLDEYKMEPNGWHHRKSTVNPSARGNGSLNVLVAWVCVYTVCRCRRSFSSKHSSTMSTIQTDSCQSSYDNLDAQSDSDDYSTIVIAC